MTEFCNHRAQHFETVCPFKALSYTLLAESYIISIGLIVCVSFFPGQGTWDLAQEQLLEKSHTRVVRGLSGLPTV